MFLTHRQVFVNRSWMLDESCWRLSTMSEASRHVQIPEGTIGNWLQNAKKVKENEIRDAEEKSLTVQGQPVDTPEQHVDMTEAPVNTPQESSDTQQNPVVAPEHAMNHS